MWVASLSSFLQNACTCLCVFYCIASLFLLQPLVRIFYQKKHELRKVQRCDENDAATKRNDKVGKSLADTTALLATLFPKLEEPGTGIGVAAVALAGIGVAAVARICNDTVAETKLRNAAVKVQNNNADVVPRAVLPRLL